MSGDKLEGRLQSKEIIVDGEKVIVNNMIRAGNRSPVHPMAMKAFALLGSRNLGKTGGMFKPKPTGPRKVLSRAPRNSPCPCGSGRKFKKCCLE
ncbi:MAG TPA: SEC-C metal-binding domain-containing protein [Planctomycetia bacterium]|nr:SEC-C metal-binding domain-containing protein [Planctomycetia bacterium]